MAADIGSCLIDWSKKIGVARYRSAAGESVLRIMHVYLREVKAEGA